MLDEMERLSSHKVKLENITLESKMKLLLDSLKREILYLCRAYP